MSIDKLSSRYTKDNGVLKSLQELNDKLSETIDVVNEATDGSETMATLTATTEVITDTVTEYTAASGVTVDGVLLKDGGVSANSMFAGFISVGAEQALSGAGAVNITAYHTKFTSVGTGDALTLADGSQIGQLKKVSYVAEAAGGDTGVLTLTGYTSITFNAITDYAVLMWNGSAWLVIESTGVTIV